MEKESQLIIRDISEISVTGANRNDKATQANPNYQVALPLTKTLSIQIMLTSCQLGTLLHVSLNNNNEKMN